MPNEHRNFSSDADVEVHVVKVRFTVNHHSYETELDPEHVKAIVWDPQAAQWLGLSATACNTVTLPQNANETGGPAPGVCGIKRYMRDLPATGVRTQIFLNFHNAETEEDRWFCIPDTVVHEVAVKYDMIPPAGEASEVVIPVRSITADINVGGDWGESPEETHIDMLWWDADFCERIRKAMKTAGKPVGRHWKVNARDGSLAKKDQPQGQLRSRIPPHRQGVPSTSASKSCSFCYHFNNCEWACTGSFA